MGCDTEVVPKPVALTAMVGVAGALCNKVDADGVSVRIPALKLYADGDRVTPFTETAVTAARHTELSV